MPFAHQAERAFVIISLLVCKTTPGQGEKNHRGVHPKARLPLWFISLRTSAAPPCAQSTTQIFLTNFMYVSRHEGCHLPVAGHGVALHPAGAQRMRLSTTALHRHSRVPATVLGIVAGQR